MNCPECGHTNPLWRSRCEQCGSPLPGALANQLREEEAEAEAKPKRKPKPDPNVPVKCPNCGYVGLPTYRGTCASCDSYLDPVKYARSVAYRQEAPGCLRIYAVLLGIGALLGMLSAFTMTHGNALFFLLLMGLSVGQGFTAFGLYDMKKWARNLALIVLGIGLLFDVFF